jgi:maleate isomerase
MQSFGTITPSSNVVVERVTIAMTRSTPEIEPHFARFGHAGSVDPAPGDYHWPAMLEAARLLAVAKPDLICWNGSKGGEIGFDKDRLLVQRISDTHGIPATTSILALAELLQYAGAEKIAFVTPFMAAANARIAGVWAGEGLDVVATIGANLTDNYSYSTVDEAQLAGMARTVAEKQPQAIIFTCTNMFGAGLCATMEAELGIPVLDSVSAGVWKSLSLLGGAGELGGAWGRLLV